VLIVALLLGCWAVLQVWAIRARARNANSPRRLFRGLCRLHRLSWSQRRLLRQLARARGLAQPAQLFVGPEYFDESQLTPALRGKIQWLRRLRQQLFAGLPGLPGQDGPAAAPASGAARPAAFPLPPAISPPALDIPPWPDAVARG
jgi:hypothetical protein